MTVASQVRAAFNIETDEEEMRVSAAGLSFLFFLAFGGATLSAQSRGNHGLAVHVSFSDGTPLTGALRVELLDRGGTPISEAYTNRGEGTAQFRDLLPEGIYQIRVSGNGVVTATSEFEIIATETDHQEFLRIRRLEVASSHTELSAEPTVSVQSLSVPEKAREAFGRAMEAYAKGDGGKAQGEFENAISIFPMYARAHNNLGVLFLGQNEKSKAKTEFSEAVEIDPGFAPGFVNIAKVDLSDGHFSDAESNLDKAVAIDPRALNAMVLLTSTAFANKKYDKALACARRVHDLPQHEQYSDVHLVAAKILVLKKKKSGAIAEYELFLKESPADPRIPRVKQLVQEIQSHLGDP